MVERGSSSLHSSSYDLHLHRRQLFRMGCPSPPRLPGSQGHLVETGSKGTLQLSGNEGSFYWPFKHGRTVSHRAVQVLSDNTTVVAYLRKEGGTISQNLSTLTATLLLWCRDREVTLSIRHIPGRLNVLADALSRGDQILHTEWSLNPQVFRDVTQVFSKPHVDLFATRWNHKLDVFVSPVPDPQAWAIDALSIDWTGMFAYAFPPTVLVPKVLEKVSRTNCELLLIAPLRWRKPWISLLLSLCKEEPMRLPPREDLLMQPRSRIFHSDPASLNLHAWRISGPLSQIEPSASQQWIASLRQDDLQP